MALFGRQSQQRGGSRFLVECKAGRMTMEGTTVKADPRKGTVYIAKGDDDLMHFCWKERAGATPEDDLIIFPNDVELKKVPQCTTGRVFLLKFKGSSRKLFYWMQENDASKDEDTFKKISDYLAGKQPPRTPAAGEGGLPPDLQALGLDDGALNELLQGVDRNQLFQMLGLGGSGGGGGATGGAGLLQSLRGSGAASPAAATTPGTTAPVTPTATPAASRPPGAGQAPGAPKAARAGAKGSAKIQLADLRNILGNVQPMADLSSPVGSAPVEWSSALTRTLLLPILSNPEFVSRLTPHLPQDPLIAHTPQELMNTIQSPQFQQAIQAFTAAFETRQLGPLIQEFNLGPEAVQAAQNGDFKAFVNALQKKAESEGGATGGHGAAKGNDDDEMSVD